MRLIFSAQSNQLPSVSLDDTLYLPATPSRLLQMTGVSDDKCRSMETEMTKSALLHPGEILREEFLRPKGLSAYALAEHCHVPRTRIERIAAEEVGITADTALRLAAALGTTPEFWLDLQSRYEIEKTRDEIGPELKTISVHAT